MSRHIHRDCAWEEAVPLERSGLSLLSYKTQHPSDLTLAVVYGRTVDDFTCLRRVRLQIDQLHVDLQIIGESHTVQLSYLNPRTASMQPVLQEILACTSPNVALDAPGHSLLHIHSMSNLRSHSFGHNFYRVGVEVIPRNPSTEQLGLDMQHIEYKFPAFTSTQNSPKPFTRIWWQADGGYLHWWTAHVYSASGQHATQEYPNLEDTVVLSSSSCDLTALRHYLRKLNVSWEEDLTTREGDL